MKPALLCLALAVAAGCAADRRPFELNREAPTTAQQIAERQAALSARGPMEPNASEKFDVAVVGGSCAPKTRAKYAVVACVNERPCHGFGLRLPDGTVTCACFERRGGCEEGTFCNQRTRTCTKVPDDLYHTQ
jgi:hypothetical protein